MSQGPLCPNLTQKVQKEVSQMANRNFSPVILLGGLSVNLNHLKTLMKLKITISVSDNGVLIEYNEFSYKKYFNQVCIPVGCVPTTC